MQPLPANSVIERARSQPGPHRDRAFVECHAVALSQTCGEQHGQQPPGDISSVPSGFAAGAGGRILHYDGTKWTLQVSGTTDDLFVIGSLGPNNALAAGTAGTVLHFDGTSWTFANGGTIEALGGGTGSPSDLFLVGDGGTILHSSDAVTWNAQASGTANDLTAAEEHLFAVGAAGTILHYDGTSWSAQSSPTTVPLNGGDHRH